MSKDILFDAICDIDKWKTYIEKERIKGVNRVVLEYLCDPEVREWVLSQIKKEKYMIAPPHMAEIPKDEPNKFRTVFVNEPLDRVLLAIICDCLCELTPHWVSKYCTSYQKGIGTGKVVQRVQKWIINSPTETVGYKTDLSKYFDSVKITFIDTIFDKFEKEFGHSCVITLLRKYYHTDLCFDLKGNLIHHYQSLKQGCAVAAWLANVLLYEVDEVMNIVCKGQYVRYSDDMLFICPNYIEAKRILDKMLNKYELTLNPKKVEEVRKDKWIKFLGFSIKGEMISISYSRLYKFVKEIKARTVKQIPKDITLIRAVRSVNEFLYGNGEYSWVTSILPVINCEKDVKALSFFVLDCLKAVATKKYVNRSLGFEHHEDHVITVPHQGKVGSNKKKVGWISGHKTIYCIYKDIRYGKGTYETIIRTMGM